MGNVASEVHIVHATLGKCIHIKVRFQYHDVAENLFDEIINLLTHLAMRSMRRKLLVRISREKD